MRRANDRPEGTGILVAAVIGLLFCLLSWMVCFMWVVLG